MKRSWCALSISLIAAGCAAPLPQTPPPGAAPRVIAPEIRAGDAWSYAFHDGYTKLPKGTIAYRVSAVQGETVTVQVRHDGRQSTELYTRAWGWREKPMTNLQTFRYEPAYPALPFPLEAGKSWRSYVMATDPATGRVNRVRIDGSVLGWDRVRVPAGEFDALKIRRLVYAGDDSYTKSQEFITEFDWYAPGPGRIVKQVSSSGYLDKTRSCDTDPRCPWTYNDWNVLELVSYR